MRVAQQRKFYVRTVTNRYFAYQRHLLNFVVALITFAGRDYVDF